MATAERHVAETQMAPIRILTVFLGLDHSFRLGRSDTDHVPILFETKIFGNDADNYQTRCCTCEQAEAMHVKAAAFATELVKAGEACVARLKQLLEDRRQASD